MLIGNPLLYARPLPTVTRGANGSFAIRTAFRAFTSSSRASVTSGFCVIARPTTSRSVME